MVWVTTGLLVLTKIADGVTTAVRIRGVGDEQNPVAAFLMAKVGVRSTIALFVGVALAVIFVATLAAIFMPYFGWLFVPWGLAIAVIQGAVAHSNWTGRNNPIVARLYIAASALRRLLRL